MKINNKEIEISDIIKENDNSDIILIRRKNRMLLSNYQVDVLKRNGIDYNLYNNTHDLLFDVEEVLNENYDEELDLVSMQLAEFIYYNETKK